MQAKTTLSLLGITLLLVSAAGSSPLAGRLTTVNRSIPDPSALQPQANDKVSDEASADIKVVLLGLRSEGFEPAEMELPAGEYLFVVRNRTGLDEVNVRLTREHGVQMGEGMAGTKQKDWKRRLKLTPGTYLLTETAHPEWACRLVVGR